MLVVDLYIFELFIIIRLYFFALFIFLIQWLKYVECHAS